MINKFIKIDLLELWESKDFERIPILLKKNC